MKSLFSLRVSSRLIILIACAVVGILLLAASFLVSERTLVQRERESSVRQAVETAHALLAHYDALVRDGKMTKPDAQQAAKDAVRSLRYNQDDYFWINDMHPAMVMHPIKPELEGKDLSTFKSAAGQFLYNDFVHTVQAQGAGFVPYLWPKPGETVAVQKVSYVKGFAPWGWIIGSGVYIDTVNAAVAQRALWSVAGTTALVAVLVGLGLAISRSVLQQLGGEPGYAGAVAQRMAQGNLADTITVAEGAPYSLLADIRAMQQSLIQTVGGVRDGAQQVSVSSQEIARGNQDLSSRTESQAAALEQTAASMAHLSEAVRHNANNAALASQMA
jgi:methyl-accepting chemotaxis protein